MAGKTPLKVIMMIGSAREGRVADRVATFIKNQLESTGNHEIEVFDPLKMPFEVLRKPLHLYKDPSEAPSWLVEANEKIKAADAFLLVSCEYNHNMPPGLTNMLDHFPPSSYAHRPAGILTYSMGSFAGIRAGMAITQMLGELGLVRVPFSFAIPKAHESIDPEGKPVNTHMEPNAQRLIAQLDWYAEATRNQRQLAPPPK